MSTANPIRKRLFELDMNQVELADKLGRSDGWVSRVARYRYEPKQQDKILVAQALETSVTELWPEGEA